MTRPPSLADDPRVRWTFLANTYAKTWLWYPRGYGFLYCTDGLLQFEPTGTVPLRSPVPFQHTGRRVLLLSPWGIPDFNTVVVFEGGEVSISVPRNREQIRAVLTQCGFEIVDAPPQRMFPFNQRKAWRRHMGEAAAAPPAAGPRLLAAQLPKRAVLGGVDQPMELSVPCPACGASIELEYHDVQGRWHAATATPFVSDATRHFDRLRPLSADETPLDMVCWQCQRPLRVVIEADEWRMSLWRFLVNDLLVLAEG